jgi:hypothetical protein
MLSVPPLVKLPTTCASPRERRRIQPVLGQVRHVGALDHRLGLLAGIEDVGQDFARAPIEVGRAVGLEQLGDLLGGEPNGGHGSGGVAHRPEGRSPHGRCPWYRRSWSQRSWSRRQALLSGEARGNRREPQLTSRGTRSSAQSLDCPLGQYTLDHRVTSSTGAILTLGLTCLRM